MVLSMTGYGRAEQERGGRDITVEIKSVNSRYFEYTSRMPRSFAFLDDKLKKLVLLNRPYLIFVYLFDKLCQGVRLSPGRACQRDTQR